VHKARLHACSTVNTNDLSVDPGTVLGGEEAHNTGNVDWLTDTVDWGPSGGVLVDLVVGEVGSTGDVLTADGVVHVGLDATWGDTVDGDLLVTSVNGHAAGEGLDGTLGGGVESVLWDTLGLTGDGAHQDDAAADGEVLVGLTGNEELSTGVDGEDTVEFLLGDVLDVAEGDDTGVGDDNVELTVVGNGLLEHLDGLGDLGDVGLDGNGVTTVGLDVLDDLLGGVGGVGVVDDDLGTTGGELSGERGTHTTAGASDKGDLAVETSGWDRHY